LCRQPVQGLHGTLDLAAFGLASCGCSAAATSRGPLRRFHLLQLFGAAVIITELQGSAQRPGGKQHAKPAAAQQQVKVAQGFLAASFRVDGESDPGQNIVPAGSHPGIA
jgi:hypothetical protein